MLGRRKIEITILTAMMMFTVVPAANAYIDPGSGSYLIQVLVGSLLGLGLAFKVFWRRVWGFVRSRAR